MLRINKVKNILRMTRDAIKVCGVSNLHKILHEYFIIKKLINGKIKSVQKYRIDNPGESFEKYLNLDIWVFETLLRCYRLGLHDKSKSLNILDLGTGAGYFPFICSYFGHKAEAVDVPDNKMYNELVSALAVSRHNERIMPFASLSNTDKYDLITAFMICFNGHKTKKLWHISEWKSFLNSLHQNNLKDNGEVFLSFNAETAEEPVSKDLLNFFLENGGEVSGSTVKIRSNYRFD